MMSRSGARGSASNYNQLCGLRGLMASPSGETIEIPIKSCFREGMTVSEFFISTHGARKGGADTALRTADSGYLTRRLVDISHDVIIKEEDCGADHGFIVKEIIDTVEGKVIVPLINRIVGRYVAQDVVNPTTGEVIVPANTLVDDILGNEVVKAGVKEVEIRSLFTCQTKDGVCIHCYGKNLATGRTAQIGEAVGVMAAQSIGEPGTQLTMRTFHTGGVAGGDITGGLPRVAELFEARNPKGEATMSEISGTVTKVEEEMNKDSSIRYKVTVQNDLDTKVYTTVYDAKLRVKEGDEIEAGDKITEGALAPAKLLAVSSVTKTENYLLKEVQKVYAKNSIDVSDKHIEVIIRQMLRKMSIIESGDTDMLPGTRVSIQEFTNKNEEALINGLHPAVGAPVILGITKAALDTDSFLSAASFQETTKVLTDAAIKGKVDHLHGLKENVMIGKLIPAGTGLIENVDEKEDFLTREESIEEVAPVESNDNIFDMTNFD